MQYCVAKVQWGACAQRTRRGRHPWTLAYHYMNSYSLLVYTCRQPLRQQLGWTTLKQKTCSATLLQVHRCLTRRAPKYLSVHFETNSSFDYSKKTWGQQTTHQKTTEYPLKYLGSTIFQLPPSHYMILNIKIKSIICKLKITFVCIYTYFDSWLNILLHDLWMCVICFVNIRGLGENFLF